MKTKTHLLVALFLGFSFLSFSQHQYSVELESLKDNPHKIVFNEISDFMDIHHRYIREDVFYFQSEVLYTEDKMTQIIEASGYTLKTFKVYHSPEEVKAIIQKN